MTADERTAADEPGRSGDGAGGTGGAALIRWARWLAGHRHAWVVIAIIALLMVNLSEDSGYLSLSYSSDSGAITGNLMDILRAAAPILLISVGSCLVIATGGIDLSVGSLMAVAGAVSMELLRSADSPDSATAAAGAIALAAGLCLLLGLLNGLLVSVVELQPFITTLVMMLAGRGLAKVVTSGQNTSAVNEPYRWVANGHVLGLPVVFLLAVLVAVLVRRSALGLMIEAVGINPEASRLAGLNRRALLITVYAVSALLAGLAGVAATGTVMTVDVSQTGYQLELDAILAVVIGGTALAGGTFSLAGAGLGALLIATLDKTIVFLGIPSSATPAFKAVVIIALYLVQSKRVRSWLSQLRTVGPRREVAA